MKEGKCNLCGSSFYKEVYRLNGCPAAAEQRAYKITEDKAPGQPFRAVQCLECGLIYAYPRYSIRAIYQMYCRMIDADYAAEEMGRRVSARVLLRKIARYRPKGRLLDIGCSTGFLLDEARKIGYDAQGVELSEWAADYARNKFGLAVCLGTLKQAEFPGNYFDAVVMSDTVEHLPDPKGALEEVRRILNPEGILCISTPDINSLLSKILGARWWGIQQAHLYYFSRNTLSKMLDNAGFNTIRFSGHTRVFSFRYWNKRLRNYNPALQKLFNFFVKSASLEKRALTLNLYDQIEAFARKKR